jgi:hypothetical protein
MATARAYPEAVLWTIQIQSGGTVPPANANMKLGPTDSISFHNGATFPVDIVFTNEFSSIYDLGIGVNSGPQGGSTSLNLTLNYTIWNHNTGQQVAGPYSVQFGIGPLPISIAALNTSPDPIAIPTGGQIAFNSDARYDIVWKLNGVVTPGLWSPQPPTVSAGQNNPQTALAGANGNTVTYAITAAQGTHGGGTVNIGT